jgi:hypothetical protein
MATVSLTRATVQPTPLQALEAWLRDNHYSQWAIERIIGHTDREGSPTGCLILDPEDEATVTEVYIEAMPAVHQCDPAWGNASGAESMFRLADDVWTPNDTLRAFPPELDDDEDEIDRLIDAWDVQHEANTKAVEEECPPVELEPPYEPTEEDLADYGAWLEQLDREQLAAMVAPISGGAPEPTAEDLADAMSQCEQADRMDGLRREDDARNPLYGYE